MFRKRALSGLLRLANPSVMLAAMETADRRALQSQAEGLSPREVCL